ncbi:MAG: DMT family transporter [Alphaproteobacteria bacterium]|nr:DMT family transporter [Alphaproteobacteria bacterium]
MTHPKSPAPTVPARTGNVLAAMFWMAVTLASFMMVAISGREAGKSVDTMHLMFFRSAVSLLLVTAILPFTSSGFRQVMSSRMKLHWTRNIIHFVAQYSWLSALMLIPLAQLFALEFTAPLWVAVLAPLLLAEKLTVKRVVAALIGFAGIVIIVRPGAVPLSAGTLYALLAALGFAGSMIATKMLVRTETIVSFLFHMSWMQLLISFIPIAATFEIPAPEVMPWVAGVGIAGITAHFALARAFTHADAIIVAPMDFLRLPLIMIVGFLLYGESVEQMVLIGAMVVVGANALNILGERSRQR